MSTPTTLPSTLVRKPGRPGRKTTDKTPEVTTSAIQRSNGAYVQASMDDILYEHGEEIARVLVSRAMSGDVGAIKLCIDKMLPNATFRAPNIDLPAIRSSADAVEALKTVVETAAKGDMPLESARILMDMIANLRESIQQQNEITEWKTEVAKLQALAAGGDAA